MTLAFLYDAYKPSERHNARLWGMFADCCSIIILLLSIIIVCQPLQTDEEHIPLWMRPSYANEYTDVSSVNRLWDNIIGRLVAPLTTLWVFSLSTGQGYTARLLRREFLVKVLGVSF